MRKYSGAGCGPNDSPVANTKASSKISGRQSSRHIHEAMVSKTGFIDAAIYEEGRAEYRRRSVYSMTMS
jgi:hypothetical protein